MHVVSGVHIFIIEVFTIFPNYYLQGISKAHKQIGIDYRALENEYYVHTLEASKFFV